MSRVEKRPVTVFIEVNPNSIYEEARISCLSRQHTQNSACFALAKVPPRKGFLTKEQIEILNKYITTHQLGAYNRNDSHQIVAEFRLLSKNRVQLLIELLQQEDIVFFYL